MSSINLREKLELRIHLAGCVICRIFEEQSIRINQMAKELFASAGRQEHHLDDSYKRELQNRIDELLKKDNEPQ